MASVDPVRGFGAYKRKHEAEEEEEEARRKRARAEEGTRASTDFSARLHVHALGCVAAFLTLKELAAFVRTCRRWHAAMKVGHGMRHRASRHWDTALFARSTVARHVTDVTMQSVSALDGRLDTITASMSWITTMHLSVYSDAQEHVLRPLARLPFLDTLFVFSEIGVAQLHDIKRLPRLRHVHFQTRQRDRVMGALFADPLPWETLEVHVRGDVMTRAVLPQLRVLLLSIGSTARMGAFASHVETLRVRTGHAHCFDAFVRQELGAFTRVRDLSLLRLRTRSLGFPTRVTGAQLGAYLAPLVHLETLRLQGVVRLGNIACLASVGRSLRVLSLRSMPLTERELRLERLPHLHTLEARELHAVCHLAWLRSGATTLRKLDLRNMRVLITDDNMLALCDLKRVESMVLQRAFTRAPAPIELLPFSDTLRARVLPQLAHFECDPIARVVADVAPVSNESDHSDASARSDENGDEDSENDAHSDESLDDTARDENAAASGDDAA